MTKSETYLYTLKECLTALAAAGTGQRAQDARLALLLDSAEAYPGLERLTAPLRAFLSAEDALRPGLLLDAGEQLLSALCEGENSETPGSLTPPEAADSGGYVRVAYGRLQPLLSALTGTGSARITLLEEYWAQHPEYFGDARVLPALAGAVGEAYGELEDLLGTILLRQGKRAVPWLEEGFALDSARGMERRIYWTARLAGADETGWLRSILPQCRREARETALSALGVSQDNAPLLHELLPRETGKCRDAVLRALSRMDDETSRALWNDELSRRSDCPSCLEGVDAPLAADLAAEILEKAFSEALAGGRETLHRADLLPLAHASFAACGKHSPAMRECWLRLAEQMDAFDRLRPADDVRNWDLTGAEILEKCLLETVLWNPSAPVRALAAELAARVPGRFLGAALLAELLTKPDTAFDSFGRYIVKNGFLRRESAAERANRIQLMRALAAVRQSEDYGCHIPFLGKDMLTGAVLEKRYRLARLDPRWAEALADPRVNRDGAVFDLRDTWDMSRHIFEPERLTI